MSTTIALERLDDGPWAVEFVYDAALVDLIKETVPSTRRWFDRDERRWLVPDGWQLDFIEQARRRGYHVIEKRAGDDSTWADAVFAAVGDDLREPVYRGLLKALHPDAGGTNRLCQDVVAAHERSRTSS